ncbi:AraC family transcriptional regulator [Vibrio neptunius]|uniref:AraC family transcriptional regulator n=1 Tax=Vibrio neptunius TaxID=170651 RepID=A0ABS3A736_9VIBR|nr:AraC family transcriptional regulator [Vibrio neptunius]MBN3494185.1 AraC family transcriptional regulator [Vibrio neptunius]MBN3516589.1 AraC family transcriptional regulator [Vibrio neptunius]MBN3550924.1 AraC family transcriptional regulator [Vibrio neptunius]MBN3579053.1 AraC family transcriptional regulator [Vibrio neptunius]MCH9872717.1 AraC family transcriptional regulator [Vibrio neptunius]
MDKVNYHSTETKEIGLIEANYRSFAFSRHYHLDFHIGLITGGQQKFHYKGSNHHVGKGQLVIMPPDELHDGQSILESGYQTRVFSLDPAWFSELAQLKQQSALLYFKQLIISDQKVFQPLSQLHQLLTCNNLSQLAKDCLPYEGFERLFSHYGRLEQKRAIPLGNQSIATLKEYLLDNLDQPMRLEQLSQLCELSPTQFQRHFKAKVGLTPYAWLSRLRMEQGMKLLKSGVSGTEVAHQVGFYDQAHFSKAFKSTYGVNPSQIS